MKSGEPKGGQEEERFIKEVKRSEAKKRKQEDEILPVVILFLFLGEFLFYCY